MDAANHQPFLAPVKLESFTKLELEWHKSGFTNNRGGMLAPIAYEVSQDGIAAGITVLPNIIKQHQRSTAIPLGASGIGFQRQ